MTDKITEDDFEYFLVGSEDRWTLNKISTDEKQQILQALEEYPKLKQLYKIRNIDLEKATSDYVRILNENIKLKAEIEELKKKLEEYRARYG